MHIFSGGRPGVEGCFNLSHDDGWAFRKVVFPNTDDAPAETAKFTRHLTVTLAIPGDFGVPEFTV